MSLLHGHRQQFDILRRAFESGDVALMECRDSKTGEVCAVICAVNRPDGDFEMVPFARLFNGNPYEELEPPDPNNPGEFLKGGA